MNEPQPRFSGAPVPTPPIPDDDGAVSGELAARLDAFAAGTVGAEQVLAELCRSRLFVPVVAGLEEADVGTDGLRREKQSTMATVLVQNPDGGRALLAFSGIEPLTRWRGEARPVPLAPPLAGRGAGGDGGRTRGLDRNGPEAVWG
ncbi:MAG: SseB family protein [Actinomycetia bacterium]|nr:SseB family protein [Actinomycetes bacterium]